MKQAVAFAGLVALLTVGLPDCAKATSVASVHGNIVCKQAGQARTLTQSRSDTEPALSPNGHVVAFVHTLKPSPEPDLPDEAKKALWLGDCLTGKVRPLAEPKSDKDIFASVGHPVFSLSGDYIYVSLVPGGDYLVIQRVDVKRGEHGFVANAELNSVLRSGPYKGDLLVTRHTDMIDRQGDHYGGYPYYIFSPNGKPILRIPKSDQWDDKAKTAWLTAKGWRAW